MSSCTCTSCGLTERVEECERLARHPMHWRDQLIELAQAWHAEHAADVDQLDPEDCLRSFKIGRASRPLLVTHDAAGAVKSTFPRVGFVTLDLEDVSNVFADLEGARRRDAKVRKVVRYSGRYGQDARVCCPICDTDVGSGSECEGCFRRFVSLEDRLRASVRTIRKTA